MDAKRSNELTTIRQACSMGLPSRVLMPIVLAHLRAAIPTACAQFTWANEAGRIADFWSDTFMPRRMAWIITHHKRYERDAGTSFHDLVTFGQPTGNLRRWWQEGFEQTSTYAAVFAPYRFKWMLDGVVRDAMRPYGCIALIRRADEPDFSAAEEDLLARALPYVAHAMRVEAARPARFVRSGRSALLLCDEAGTVLEWSGRAHELCVFALVENIDLDARIERNDFADVQPALREVVSELRSTLDGSAPLGALPTVVRRNRWGEFAFHAYRLEGAAGAPARLGVVIEQLVPLEAHLLERVNATNLSARQKDVALLSAKGLSNERIAQQLNLTPQTVKDYFKAIYGRLGINSQRELQDRLSIDAPEVSSREGMSAATHPPRWVAGRDTES